MRAISLVALALLLPFAQPAGAASPHLKTTVEDIAAANATQPVAKPGLFDLGDGHLLFVPTAANQGRPLPLLIVLHGAGGTAASLVRRFHKEAERLGIILVAAKARDGTWDIVEARSPGPASGSASRVNVGSRDFSVDVPRIDTALRRALESVRADSRRIGIGGFSDGASYALSVGTANPQLFSSVLAFSPGMAVLASPPREHNEGRRNPQRIFVSHGRNDPILSYGYTVRRIVPQLRGRGIVTFREFDGTHQIPADISAEALSLFLGASG